MDSILKSVIPAGTDEGQFLNDVEGDVASSLQANADESIQELLKKAKEEVKAEYDGKASEVHALHKKTVRGAARSHIGLKTTTESKQTCREQNS